MMKPATIKKMLDGFAEYDLRLYNNCFNVATATLKLSKTYYELRVEVTHPELQWMRGNIQDTVSLVYWYHPCSGRHIPIPPEFDDLIARMKVYATMDDADANALSKSNKRAFFLPDNFNGTPNVQYVC